MRIVFVKKNRLLWLLNAVAAFYLLGIGIWAIPNNEDFCFLDILDIQGFWGGLFWWYTAWQGRISAYLLIQFSLILYKLLDSLWPYTCFIWAFCVLGATALSKTWFTAHKARAALLSAFFMQSLLLTFFDFRTLFRLNVSAMYFGGLAFMLWALAFMSMARQTQHKVLFSFLAFLCAWAGGCSSEAFGLTVLVLGLFFLLSLSIRICKLQVNTLFGLNLSAHWAAWLTLTGWAFGTFMMLLAPGTSIRRAQFQKVENISSFMNIFLSTQLDFAYAFWWRSTYSEVFLLCLSILLLAFCIQYYWPEQRLSLMQLSVGLITLFCSFMVSLVPTVYALSNAGPRRAMVLSFFFVFVGITCFIYFIVTQLKLSQDSTRYIFYTLSTSFLIILSILFCEAYPRVRAYHFAQKTLMDTLSEKYSQNPSADKPYPYLNAPVIRIGPLPSAKPYLFEQWLTTNPEHWAHHCLCDGLNLNRRIRVDSTLQVGEVRDD